MLRDSRTRAAAPGCKWTDEEQVNWRAALQAFFHDKEEGDEANNGERAKKRPRIAPLDQLRALDNSMKAFYGVGLGHFRTGDHDRVLCLTMDECGTNWCGFWFLRNAKRLRVEAIFDGFHRRSNDLQLVVQESGFMMCLMKGHVCNNVCYGPW